VLIFCSQAMKARPFDFIYIFLTIALTVFGQLIVKWRVTQIGGSLKGSAMLVRFLMDPGILCGLLGAFVAALCWMTALSKFQLSYAYPFTSLSFALVLLLSAYLLKEPITVPRALGVAIIIVGTIVAARG